MNRHDTKADESKRTAAESAMTPKTELSLTPPSSLNGHKVARDTWKRVVGLYNEVDGKIATSFDADILVKYCILEEEVLELEKMRAALKKQWDSSLSKASKFKIDAENVKEYLALWDIVNALSARFQGMDARLDGKRKLLHSLAQSLYLTPRSRAGVEPPTKPPEKPKSETEKALE